jgi:hypothetical protein
MDTLNVYGWLAATEHLFMIMKNNLKQHGVTNKMVSKQFEALTDDELAFMEKLLGEALGTEMEQDKTWKSKNGYSRPFQKQRKILNCLNAIKSQRTIQKVRATKW